MAAATLLWAMSSSNVLQYPRLCLVIRISTGTVAGKIMLLTLLWGTHWVILGLTSNEFYSNVMFLKTPTKKIVQQCLQEYTSVPVFQLHFISCTLWISEEGYSERIQNKTMKVAAGEMVCTEEFFVFGCRIDLFQSRGKYVTTELERKIRYGMVILKIFCKEKKGRKIYIDYTSPRNLEVIMI